MQTIPEDVLEQLRQIDSCTVSNAIERFDVRTRNEGFVNGSVRCIFPDLPPTVGYAVTARIRTSSTPVAGRYYYDRIDWWSYVRNMPGPRFLVIEDVDHVEDIDRTKGVGALFGEIHASIAVALGCEGYLTNGAVRDLPGVRASGLQMFAGSVSVSHSYAHLVEFDGPVVEIGGLQIKPGDLLHGDQHGIVCVPLSIAPEIPKMAAKIRKSERTLIEFCRSSEFSFDQLAGHIQRAAQMSGVPDSDPN